MTARSFGRLPPHQKHATITDTVAHWKLNEASATDDAADSGADNIDLTKVGNPTVEIGPHEDADASASKGARGFDGSSQWFERPTGAGDYAATLQDASGYTVAAWVRAASGYASNGAVVSYDAFGSNESDNIQFRLSILSDREIAVRWEYGAGSNETFQTEQYVADDEWSHVVVVVCDDDQSHLKFMTAVYLDGECVAVRRGQERPTGGSNAFWQIGGSYDASGDAGVTPGQLFDGSISDVAVYGFAGSPEFARDCYARAVKDFQLCPIIKKDGTGNTAGPDRYNETIESVAVFTRVKVRAIANQTDLISDGWADPLGWIDLSKISDVDAVLSTSITDERDAQSASASVVLSTRVVGEIGLGEFLSGKHPSAVLIQSLYDNPLPGDVAREGMEIKIEHAWMPHGSSRESADPHFMCMFHGKVISADHGADEIKLGCIDLMASLQDQWVEPGFDVASDGIGRDIQLGSSGGIDIEDNLQELIDVTAPSIIPACFLDDTGSGGKLEIEVFLPSRSTGLEYGRPHQFVANDSIRVTSPSSFADIYTVDSVTDEQITTVEVPTPAAAESPTDVSVLGVPSKFGYLGCYTPGRQGSVELYVPTSPGWAQRSYNVPSTMTVASALEEQAAQIGWLCRFLWDDDRKQYRLTLYDPSVVGNTRYVSPNMIIDQSDFGFSSDLKRNMLVVEYRDSATALPDGGYQRDAVVSKDSTTVQRYGRRYARMGLFNATNIDSQTEADRLADVGIAAMGGDEVDTFSIIVPWTPDIGVGDNLVLIAESADSNTGHSTGSAFAFPIAPPRFVATTNNYAVAGVKHDDDGSGAMTTLQLRPDAGGGRSRKFRELMSERGRTGGDGTRGVNSSAAPTLTEIAGPAILVQWPSAVRANVLSRLYSHTEVHCSTSSGFTPSSSSLVDSVSSLQSTIRRTIGGGLTIDTGTTYYVKLIHFDQAGNRVFSSQASITTAP